MSEEQKELAQINKELTSKQADEIIQKLETLLPPDQVEYFSQLSKDDQIKILKGLKAEESANIFEVLSDTAAAKLAGKLDISTLVAILDEMEPDEAADLLGDLEPELRNETIPQLADPEEMQSLLKYPDESAGGLMTVDYYSYPEQTPVGEVFSAIQKQSFRDEEIPYIYALDEQGRLTGVVRLGDLIRAHPEQPLLSVVDPQFVSVHPEEDQEAAAKILTQYDLLGLPVVDENQKLLGVITVDDAMNTMEVEATEDILQTAGILAKSDQQTIKSEQMVKGSIWRPLIVRIPFLLITMVGGLLAGNVIGVFEEALETVVVLAFFIPVVMNMGGNSGSQSTSIFIRGHTLGQIDTLNFGKLLFREFFVGLGIGISVGIIAGIIAGIWQDSLQLGLVVGLSILTTVMLATGLGFLVPLLLNKIGVDPAVASEPIITTILDITGVLIYFYIAILFIGQLA